MIAAVADTHAIIWYLTEDPRLSANANRAIETADYNSNQIAISSITLVEMVYLIEKGKIPASNFTQLANTMYKPKSALVEIPVELNIARALSRVDSTKIPDMPDRIIAATALNLNVPIISKDGKIRLSGLTTIW